MNEKKKGMQKGKNIHMEPHEYDEPITKETIIKLNEMDKYGIIDYTQQLHFQFQELRTHNETDKFQKHFDSNQFHFSVLSLPIIAY